MATVISRVAVPLKLQGKCVKLLSAAYNSSSVPKINWGLLEKYVPPEWATGLSYVPTDYFKLSCRPTPIQPWNLPGVPDGFSVAIKRDDMTGSTLSGNKVRKLEFLLAEAVDKGCNTVVTCGDMQSNHCRAVALTSAQVGLESHLLLEMHEEDKDSTRVPFAGNTMLKRLAGAHIVMIDPVPYEGKHTFVAGLMKKMEEYCAHLKLEGKKPYIMPLGGSSLTGLWGHIEAFREMMVQGITSDYSDVVCAFGSGGMSASLAISNYLTGSKLRVHTVLAEETPVHEAYEHVDHELADAGLGDKVAARDIIDVIDGYEGGGHSVFTDEDIDKLIAISASTGIVLDHTYNIKAITGLTEEMTKNPDRFLGKKILYIHSGGLFNLFDQRIDVMAKQSPLSNRILTHPGL